MDKRAQRLAEVALAAVAVAALAATGAVLAGATTLGDPHKAQAKAWLGLAAIAVIGLERLPTFRRARGVSLASHAAIALAALAAFYHFGSFPGGGFVDYWEQFHYQLGSKYFPELGYDGLYEASLAAERESAPERPAPPFIRDLRSNWHIATDSPRLDLDAAVARFSPERWRDFVSDHARYLAVLPPASLEHVRLDHGYNPSPAWTFVGRLFSAPLGASPGALALLASLDLALVAVMFAAVLRTFGARTGCLAIALFGLGFGWPFHHVGAFLRLDWLAASVVGFCCLERRRPTTAGVLFGYAALVRLFPALFLLGPAVVALRETLRGERPRWALRLAAGFALAIALGLAAGSATGRGPGAWREFGANIELHRETWARSRIGLAGAVLNGPDLVRYAVHRDGPKPWRRKLADARDDLEARRWPARALATGLLVSLAAALVRASPMRAAVLGLVAIYALTPMGSYYWIALMAAAFLGATATLSVLALSVALHAVHGLGGGIGLAFALMSLGLLPVFAAWIGPDALRTLRRARNVAD